MGDDCREVPSKARSQAREYDELMAEVHRDLVAAGVVTLGRKQEVDLALVEEFLRLRGGSPSEDGFALLTRLEDDLDDRGRATVTLGFVLLMDRRMMEVAAEDVAAEMTDDESDPQGQGIGLLIAGEFREAIGAFSRAIESGRYGPMPYRQRGRAFQLAGDAGRAILDYDRFLATGGRKRRPTVLACRAEALATEGLSAKAIQSLADAIGCVADDYDQFCRTNPSDEEALENTLVELQTVVSIVERLGGTMAAAPDAHRGLGEVEARLAELRRRMGA